MKNSFVVQLAVKLGFAAFARLAPKLAFLVGGVPGCILEIVATTFLGFLVDQGILAIDLTLTAYKVALEDDKFRELALKAYVKATKKIYTPEEKVAIRKQYLDVIREFGSVGNGLRNSPVGTNT